MRSRFTLPVSLFLLLCALSFNVATLRAADTDDDEADDYDVTARVARVSLLSGEVSLRRAGDSSWERAQLNMPLVEGDTLATGSDARLEIQIDAHNFVRVAGDSVLRVLTLREEGVALSLDEGTATLQLARFEREREYFEIDAPGTTLAAERRGVYRLDVGRGSGNVRAVVRGGGQARIYSETSGFTLRDKRSAELVYNGDDAGDWELTSASAFDEWDRWTDERERSLASRLRYENRERYYDRDVWGAEELDAYGDWSYVNPYGWVWRPHVTVVNNYSDWAPYRYGHWSWCPPYGWTWVADEPWGWAPYHYGRWVFHDNYWAWAPRGYGYAYRRSWWRPALVAFVSVNTSFGEQVCWYPLRHGQRDPRSGFYARNFERLRALRRDEFANLRRTNPAYLRAVSTLPAREFGARGTRARPAPADIARRAITGEPVRGRLSIVPEGAARNVERDASGRTRLSIARPAPISPARALPQRPTGAAARTPGVALDNQLRRARIFNNREPRTLAPSSGAGGERDSRNNSGGGNGAESPRTGAVMRPARPAVRTPLESPDADGNEASSPVIRARPSRPGVERGTTGAENPSRDEQRVRRPVFRDAPVEGGSAGERQRNDDAASEPEPRRARPARPTITRPPDDPSPRTEERNERPDTTERSRPAPAERPAPERPRQETPSRRPERPEIRDEQPAAPRVERERPTPRVERSTPREERPAPREERREPRVERPAPREEHSAPREERAAPPPPRQEAPPPPRQEQPPPQRSEPPPRNTEQPRERPAPVRPEAPRIRPDSPAREK